MRRKCESQGWIHDFRDILIYMLTVGDIAKLTQILATKQDLEKLTTKEELYELRNDVFTRMDQVYSELKIYFT